MVDSADVFPEMQRLHKKYGITTKGTQLLFISGNHQAAEQIQTHDNKTTSIISSGKGISVTNKSSKKANKSSISSSSPVTVSSAATESSITKTTTMKSAVLNNKTSTRTNNKGVGGMTAGTRRTDWSAISKVTKTSTPPSIISTDVNKPSRNINNPHLFFSGINKSAAGTSGRPSTTSLTPSGTQLVNWGDDFYPSLLSSSSSSSNKPVAVENRPNNSLRFFRSSSVAARTARKTG
jgi:hypothetical protein